MTLQKCDLGYYFDAYFQKHKIEIEIDKKGRQDRNIEQEPEN